MTRIFLNSIWETTGGKVTSQAMGNQTESTSAAARPSSYLSHRRRNKNTLYSLTTPRSGADAYMSSTIEQRYRQGAVAGLAVGCHDDHRQGDRSDNVNPKNQVVPRCDRYLVSVEHLYNFAVSPILQQKKAVNDYTELGCRLLTSTKKGWLMGQILVRLRVSSTTCKVDRTRTRRHLSFSH